jgi:rRNA maturation endonuclease Nob1
MASGIEVTAHCPTVMAQYRLNKVNLEIDGQARVIAWDEAVFCELPAGVHKIGVSIQGLLAKGGARQLDVTVQTGQVTLVQYSLTLLSLINPGKLEVTGTRPAAGGVKCAGCGKSIPVDAQFCPACGHAAGMKTCGSCGKVQPAGKFCMKCGSKMP